MRSFYTKLFSAIFEAALGHMQLENPANTDHLFRHRSYWGNSGTDEFRLVEDTRTTLQEYVVLEDWESRQLEWKTRMQELISRKGEAILPWMAAIRDCD